MASLLERPELASSGCRPEDGVRDMIVISDIDEKGIKTNLKTRYKRDQVYTFTGSILVAVNPYKELKIYEQDNVLEYSEQKLSQVEPHIFAIAEVAFQHLKSSQENQSCIISGESGAGKTESTKFILQYLCSVTNHTSFWVEQQILEANTVLEAFGNAKTVRNDNSSRFGKFMQVCFDQGNQIKGCIVQDYLLEQSRITFQSMHERNYHVFYQLLAGAHSSPELQGLFYLKPKESYNYINQSGCYELDGVNDSKMFDNLRLAMNVIQISESMINGIFSVLSSVLLLGNLQFEDIEGEKSDLTDQDKNLLHTVCDLLGLDFEGIIETALFRQIQVRGMVTSIPFKFPEACENRHAMAKALYSRTFAWLIDAINKCINPGQHQSRFMGVLDIFGFENFEANSFEQLCINYTNEKLHRFFNHYVFALEQETYQNEEISFSHITFTDNSLCVELIERFLLTCTIGRTYLQTYFHSELWQDRSIQHCCTAEVASCFMPKFGHLRTVMTSELPPKCVLKMLDEECRFPQGTDKSYLAKQHTALEDHEYYIKGIDRRTWEIEFGIRHYAGAVTYKSQGFLDKNKDVQQDQLFDLMHNSTNEFVKDLTRFQDLLGVRLEGLQGRQTISRTTRGKPTVGDTFKHQLSALVDILSVTNPWYVRCLKPNSKKQPNNFQDDEVFCQLKYSGMLDIIRIKREGYPVHVDSENFYDKYKCLSTDKSKAADKKEAIKHILGTLNLPITEWQVGKTKVFMRNSVFEPLEEKRWKFLSVKALVIQTNWRGFHWRRDFQRKKTAAMIIQTSFKSFRHRLAFKRQRRAAIVLQAHLRGTLARRYANKVREEKRLEEERIRLEEIEKERLAQEQEKAEMEEIRRTMEESQAELESLTQLIESMWNHYNPPVSPTSLDLEEIFSFLQEEKTENFPEITEEDHSSNETKKALDLINEEFEALDEIWAIAEGRKSSKQDEKEIKVKGPLKNVMEADSNMANDNSFDNISMISGDMENIPLPPPPKIPSAQSIENLDTISLPPPPSDIDEPSVPPGPQPSIPPPPPLPGEFYVNGIAEKPCSITIPPPPSGPPPITSPLITRTTSSSSTQTDTESSNGMAVPSPPPLPPSFLPLSKTNKHAGHVSSVISPNENTDIQQSMEQKQIDSLSPSTEAKIETLKLQPAMADSHRADIMMKSGIDLYLSSPVENGGLPAETEEYYEMLDYAEKHFNSHLKDTGGTLMKSLKKKRQDEGELTKLIRDEVKEDVTVQTIQYIVRSGIERIELRDEIFCQLIRQSNENPDREGWKTSWFIMAICCAGFSPSKHLHKYLLCYVKRYKDFQDIGKFARLCHSQLVMPRAMSRKYPPSASEIYSMRNLSPMICKIHFMDGKTKAVSIMPCDSTAEVLEKIARKIGLKSVEGWSLYEVTSEYERFIRGYEYLADILALWEQNDKLSALPSKYETVSRKGPIMALGGQDAKFVFRKRVYRHVQDIPNDPVEYHLLYAEAVNKVVKYDEYSVSEKVALQLAGLQAQVICGEYEEDKDSRYNEVEQFLCKRLLQHCERDWRRDLSRAHRHYGSGKSELESKVWYLTCVKQFPLYGCTLFPIVHKGLWPHSSDALLAINMDGIKFIRSKDKFVIYDLKYLDIESIKLDPNDNYVMLELRNSAQVDCVQRCFMFETNHKEDIGILIASYSPTHASWLKPDSDSLKKMKMTDEEKLKLYEELVRCRRTLSESRLLQRPVQDGGPGFLKTTLRKLTKSRLEKYRSYASANTGLFDISHWSYTKVPIKQSLTVINDQQVEDLAVRMFNAILVYAGVEDSESGEFLDHIEVMQNLMQRCLDNDSLCIELYMQLIKQTTDHPDPNSIVNKRNWQLMAVSTSTLSPPNSRVQKYLQIHLRKCSLDSTSDEGRYARFCHKCLLRTLEKKRRLFPPSVKELPCILQRKPINERIYFLTGEHRVIEFDSAATVSEVVKIVKAKIGMRSDAEHFSINEIITGAAERAMRGEERLSDTLSKWERLSKLSPTREMKLIFKKRLMIEPYFNVSDPIECDLVFHQLIEDVFEQRIPITMQHAIELCALKIQSELQDLKYTELDYRPFLKNSRSSVMRILPREMRGKVQVDEVATAHKKYTELSSHQAILAFIDILKQWPLFGATVFEVSQNYTSILPKTLLLAIHERGIHLLEVKTFKTISSFAYSEIATSSSAIKSIMIVIGHVAKGTKFMFNTNQSSQIAYLIKDYMDEIQAKEALLPKEKPQRPPSGIIICEDAETRIRGLEALSEVACNLHEDDDAIAIQF